VLIAFLPPPHHSSPMSHIILNNSYYVYVNLYLLTVKVIAYGYYDKRIDLFKIRCVHVIDHYCLVRFDLGIMHLLIIVSIDY